MTGLWQTARRILKWGGIVAGSLALLALLRFVIAFVSNSQDEPLSPQAQALLQPPPNPFRPEDNLYLALTGFDAPSGGSIIAVGQARVAYYNRNIDAALRDPSPQRMAGLRADGQRLAFKGDMSFLHPLDGSVWSEASQHQAQVEKLLADNAELYRRYLDLLPMHGYYETAVPSEFAPLAAVPGELHNLLLAAIALHLRSAFTRERERALADLELDVQLWRTVLTARGALLWKMLSVAYLQSDYLLLADLIADERAPPPAATEADALVPLFALKDWDIGSALAAEFRLTASALREVEENPPATMGTGSPVHEGFRGWLDRTGNRITAPFFKVNATENLLARQTAREMLAAADPAKLREGARPAGSWLLEDQSVWSLPFSYNPVGKVLAAVATPPFDNYPRRAWDGAALQRLVRLGYEIRRRGLDGAEIPAYLAGHPEWSTHPADGRPFLWDVATGELRVQTVAQYARGRRFSIHLWRDSATDAHRAAALAPPGASR